VRSDVPSKAFRWEAGRTLHLGEEDVVGRQAEATRVSRVQTGGAGRRGRG